MDNNQFMLLSNVPLSKPRTVKKKFSKLCLSSNNVKREEVQPKVEMKVQRKLFDDSDNSLMTDDEEDKENPENNIFYSPKDAIQEKRVSDHQDTYFDTQCSNVELEMSKLEISHSIPQTDDEKIISQPLFGTESDNFPLFLQKKEQQKILSDIVEESLFTEFAVNKVQNRQEAENTRNSALTISSTELNTTVGDDENVIVLDDESGEIIDATDSLQPPEKSSNPNCSMPDPPSKNISITDSVMRRISDFFDKIPPVLDQSKHEYSSDLDNSNKTVPETPEASFHNVIDNSQSDVEERTVPPASSCKNKASQEIKIKSTKKIQGETINISAKIKVDIVIRTQSVSEDSPSDPESDLEESDGAEQSIVIPKQEESSEEKETEQKAAVPTPIKPKDHKKLKKEPRNKKVTTGKPIVGIITSEEAFEEVKKPGNQSIKSKERNNSNRTRKENLNPKPEIVQKGNDEIELDEASIAILNSVYGSEWKTPQLMNSLKKKSKQSVERYEPNMTDFQKFNANVRKELESTRVEDCRGNQELKYDTPPAKGCLPETRSPFFKHRHKPSPKRTALKDTPKYRKILQVIDSDTSDSADDTIDISDDSYKISESSSEEEGEEQLSRSSRRGKASKKRSREKFDFTQNASSDSELEDTIFIDLDKIEDDGKEKRKDKESKRKLFSEVSYDTPDTCEDEEEKEREKKEETDKKKRIQIKNKEVRYVHCTPVNKKLEAIKSTELPRFSKCGFLLSLDPKISKNLADAEAFAFRENYKTKKTELSDKLYKIYNENVFDNKLDVSIKWNKKLLTTAGRCINMGKLGVRTAQIELSDKVLTSGDRLRCTLIHELCHAAAWIFNAEKKGHAGNWRMWTEKAVKALPELPKITVCHQYNIEYKYTYQCKQCTAKTQMHSKTKKTENIRCKFCHGKIEILLNKRTKAGDVLKTPIRAASGFALFVKENYKRVKNPDIKHAEVMKLLGQDFAKMKVQKNQTEF